MPKLSLCLIAGNVGVPLLTRFLDCFGPLAEEIIVVRAIGHQVPDGSLAFAKSRGCRTAEYLNAQKNGDWPHVDNFAAARNLGWEMATADWLMWADTDDLISAGSRSELRAMIEQHGDEFDMLQCPYVVPEAGYAHNLRERIVRRGISRWTSPVHECLEPIDPAHKWRTVTCPQAEIVHAPASDTPRGRHGRNLRIIQSLPEDQLTTSLRYHIFAEHCTNGNLAEAALAGQAFLMLPDGGRNERFEVAIWLSILATDARTKRDWATLALTESPGPREPYVILADLMLNAGEIEDAEAYHRAAGALPMPPKPPWNLRRSMWTWKHVQQGARIARAKGQFAHADAIELNHFLRHDGLISLLHATRGRPEKAVETRELWLTRAENPDAIEHIFGCDPDDERGPDLGHFRHIVQDPGGGPCGAWNMAANGAHGEILVQVSDDMIPPHGWDRLILAAIGDRITTPAVLRVSDGHRTDGLIVLAIVTRAWIRQQGYLFHPAFFSMYSDNWLTECAEKAGAIIEARAIVFEHQHPLFTGEAWPPTTAESNSDAHYAHGFDILTKLRAGSNPISLE